MTEIERGVIPDALRTHPRAQLFAYVNALPEGQVMGVVREEKTGKMVAHCILPTKQRVMLGLGIGNDKANAHNTYRQLFPHGYHLDWIDHPDTDERTQRLKRKLEGRGETRRGVKRAIREERVAARPTPHEQEADAALAPTSELTAQLVRAGAEQVRGARAVETKADSNRDSHGSNNGSRDAEQSPPDHPTPDKSSTPEPAKGFF